jgi:hypothetical protein
MIEPDDTIPIPSEDSLEVGVRLESTGWMLLDSPPVEDRNDVVPVTADNEGSNLMEPPIETKIAEPAPSMATNATTSKPPGGGQTRNSPDDTFDVVSGGELNGRETLAFGMS